MEAEMTFEDLFKKKRICSQCDMPLNVKHFEVNSVAYTSLYAYADIRTMMLQYKELKDEALASFFMRNAIIPFKARYHGWLVVSVPSRIESRTQRGFDHIALMFQGVCQVHEVFENLAQYDQSVSKNRSDIRHFIQLVDKELVRDQKVVIVDDIRTSGETLKVCVEKLQNKVRKLEVFIISDVRNTQSSQKG